MIKAATVCGFCGREAGEPCPESLQWRKAKGLPGAKPAPCFPEPCK